jgi:hypothetical protein
MPEKPEPIAQEPVTDEPEPDVPVSDTSTDWDEWMKQHGGKPRPVSDVADAEGKVTPTPR